MYSFAFSNEKFSHSTAMDTHSFCEVLGGDEANAQLRRHWDHWVTDDVVARLAATGVNSLRLPVGDYQFAPYGPYKTCFKGSLKRVDAVLDMAHRHNLSVLLDVVRSQVCILVVLGTRPVLTRPWCAGEIVTAWENKTPVVVLDFGEFKAVCNGHGGVW